MAKQADQLQIINKIIKLAEMNSEVDVLWLYGSRARNNDYFSVSNYVE